MDDDPRLPDVYAEYLRLHGRGFTDAQIAARLRVDPAGLPLLARLATAKQTRVHSDTTERPTEPDGPSSLTDHVDGS